jgi:hypothetical protein
MLDPLTAGTASERAIVEVEWSQADALPFPLCISSRTDGAHGSVLIENVSVALGNIVLADHGRTVTGEHLGPVPEPRLLYPPERAVSHCSSNGPVPVLPRFRPRLAEGPLTRAGRVLNRVVRNGIAAADAVPFDPEAPASAAMTWDMTRVVPDIALSEHEETAGSWTPRGDLLDSESTQTHFVVETEHDGVSRLRFGDGVHGKRPASRTEFWATYRVGNGIAGNVGPGAIAHAVTDDGRIDSVTNPMAARGGRSRRARNRRAGARPRLSVFRNAP